MHPPSLPISAPAAARSRAAASARTPRVARSPWTASSPCTTGCLRSEPRVPRARAVRRGAAFAAVLARALADGDRLRDDALLRVRARAALDAFGVRLRTNAGTLSVPGDRTGHPGTLIVANHISWLDVVAIQAVEPVATLAKREVGQWPVIGTLARRVGTRFIDRDAPRALPGAVAEVARLLRGGQSVMVFPQGVTWCAGTGEGFRRALFQAALDARAPVRPLSIDYTQRSGPSTAAAFVGDDTFGASLRRVTRAEELTVTVTAHPPIGPAAGASDRRALAANAFAAVSRRGGTIHGRRVITAPGEPGRSSDRGKPG